MKSHPSSIKTNSIKRFVPLTILLIILLGSCTVSNNLYVNDPIPLSKNDMEGYGGFGMGLQPKIDSVGEFGEVFSSGLQRSYNLVLGGRYGVTHLFNIGASMHLPEIVGGFGLTLRPQMSLFPNVTNFNMAIAADFGGTFSKDSITILGSSSYQDNETRGQINADFSLPIAQKFSKNTWLVITPRYSFNTFYLRREFEGEKSKKMRVEYPALSLGLRMNKVQVESTVVKFNENYKFMAGIVVFLGSGNKWDFE